MALSDKKEIAHNISILNVPDSLNIEVPLAPEVLLHTIFEDKKLKIVTDRVITVMGDDQRVLELRKRTVKSLLYHSYGIEAGTPLMIKYHLPEEGS